MNFLDANNKWTPEFMKYIEETARPSIKLTLTKELTQLTDSKVGGKPWLPPMVQIPHDEDGTDYLFIAQVNWAQMPQLDGFPSHGFTSFFVKQDDTFGLLDQAYHVLHFEDVSDTTEIDPFQPEDPDLYSPVLGGPYKLTGQLESKLIPYKNFQSEHFQLPPDHDEVAYSKYWDLSDASGSRIGGYPYFTQDDPRSEDSILLLQLDMEGDHKDYYVSWGDSGVANFFIRKEDLLRLDFSNVGYTWDCL
ncbi:YwqG family protein [uncultured Brevibacillus sp.]|uniref:YwqG family protein n=1 Tax=uncultured Brevibacillus sp. TaxID=169970 RepID=UPI00259A8733|nr:DUF1963 domain-containing protein [uncultured Brevibacillus sp.]